MAEETERVFVRNVVKAGKVWKVDGEDVDGNVRTYTMHEVDRDSGTMNQPPQLGEDCIFVYATTTKPFDGKTQTTWWLNEVRMPQNPRPAQAQPVEPPQQIEQPIHAQPASEIAEPVKDAYDVRQDATRVSIEKQQALRYAVEFYSNSPVEPNAVVAVAWKFYNEFLVAVASPEDVEEMLTQEQQGEVIQNSSHSYEPPADDGPPREFQG